MSGYRVVRLGELDPIAVAGVHWRPVRRTLGIAAFGINAYSADAGGDVVESHTEEAFGHEEAYVVLTGRATFTLDGETIDAPAGSLVFVSDPTVRRHARAEEDGTMVLAIGGKPGEPYFPSAWEEHFAVEAHHPSGDHRAAIAEHERALGRYPDHPGILYSLGCWHALSGEPDVALGLVEQAIRLEPRYAEWARQDDVLASVRDRLPPAPTTG